MSIEVAQNGLSSRLSYITHIADTQLEVLSLASRPTSLQNGIAGTVFQIAGQVPASLLFPETFPGYTLTPDQERGMLVFYPALRC